MKYLAIILAFLVTVPLSKEETNEDTVTITVVVQGLRNTSGVVGVALFDDDSEFPDGEIYKSESVSVSASGSVEVVFEDVPRGDYAVAAMHDENENDDVDMNEYGMPTEGFAFSNDAMGDMGPPDFDEAAFSAEEDTEVTLTIIYLGGYK